MRTDDRGHLLKGDTGHGGEILHRTAPGQRRRDAIGDAAQRQRIVAHVDQARRVLTPFDRQRSVAECPSPIAVGGTQHGGDALE